MKKKSDKKQGTAKERLHEHASRLASLEIANGLSKDKTLIHIMRIAIKAEEYKQFPTALKAMELIGKHLQMFPKQVEVTLGATMVNDILSALPEQYAVAVRAVLVANGRVLPEGGQVTKGAIYD